MWHHTLSEKYKIPFSSSISTIFAWPLHAAECKGVSPNLFCNNENNSKYMVVYNVMVQNTYGTNTNKSTIDWLSSFFNLLLFLLSVFNQSFYGYHRLSQVPKGTFRIMLQFYMPHHTTALSRTQLITQFRKTYNSVAASCDSHRLQKSSDWVMSGKACNKATQCSGQLLSMVSQPSSSHARFCDCELWPMTQIFKTHTNEPLLYLDH